MSYVVLHLPEDDGNSANTYFYFHSVEKLRTQVPSSIQKPHAAWIFLNGIILCKGNSVRYNDNCDPRGRLGPTIGHGGAWLMGPGCGVLSARLQWMNFVYYYGCTNVCDRDYSISRRPTVYSYDTCTKSSKMTALLQSFEILGKR